MTCKIHGRSRLWALLLLALSPALACAALPLQPALLRFKFGPADSPACPGFLQVTDQTRFTAELGYGWMGKIGWMANRRGPDALFRSVIASQEPFAVTLPDGAYFAWFVVGDNDSYPVHYTVTQKTPQGKAQTLLAKDLKFQDWWDWYFSLQDVEWDDVQSMWDTYVEHKFKTCTVPVAVTGGRMQLNFGGAPVCCLAVYPEAIKADAEALLDGVRKAQRAEFDKMYKLKLPTPTIAPELMTPAAQQAGFILLAANPLAPEGPEDVYQDTNESYLLDGDAPSAKGIEGFGALGQSKTLVLTILPLRDAPSAKVTVSDLKGPAAAVMAASAVEIGCQRYAICANSPLGTGSRLVPRDIVRRDTVRLHDRIPQRIWLTVKVPADAKPGNYEGTITVTATFPNLPISQSPDVPGASASAVSAPAATLPLRFKVLPFQLDPASNVTRGPFYYFPTGIFSDWRMEQGDKFWSIVENDIKFLAERGINSIPEIPDSYKVLTRDGQPNPEWPQEMDRFVALYRKYNFAGPIPPYSLTGLPGWAGFPPSDKPNEPISDKTRKYLTTYLTTLKKEEKEHGWPEIVIYVSDELSNEGAAGGRWGVRYLQLLDEIKKTIPGGFRTCSSINGTSELVMTPLLDITMPNAAMSIITDKWIESLRAAGHQLWLYNGGGFSRFTFGFFLWRTGATGRYVWHFDFRTYSDTTNPYNPFDYWINVKYLFAFPTRDGTRRATPDSERNREGIDDLRYLVTLEKAVAANPGKPESKAAREWLAWLRSRVDPNPRSYSEWGNWHPSAYDKLRWQAAQHILKVQGMAVP